MEKKKKPAKKRPIKSTREIESEKKHDDIEDKGLRLAWIKFIDAYIANGGNGQEAYKVAYPDVSDDTARANAPRLLAKDSVKEELNNKLEAQRVTEESIVNLGLAYAQAGLLNEKMSMAGSKSLEMLAKMKGLLVDTKKIAFTSDNPAVFTAPYTKGEAQAIDEATNTSRIIE